MSTMEGPPGSSSWSNQTDIKMAEPDCATPKTHRQVVAAESFLILITTAFVIVRCFTRYSLQRTFNWQDWITLSAWAGSVAYGALIICMFINTLNEATTGMSWKPLQQYMQAFFFMYPPVMLLAKLSICGLLWHLFSPNRSMRFAIIFAAIYNTVLQLITFISLFALAPPDREPSSRNVVPLIAIGSSGFNIAGDFYLLILPFIPVVRLHMPLKKKIGCFFIFLTGALTCISSILCEVYRVKSLREPLATWLFAPVIILASFELYSTIIVSCLLTLPAFFRCIDWRHSRILQYRPSFYKSNSDHAVDVVAELKSENSEMKEEDSIRSPDQIHIHKTFSADEAHYEPYETV